MMRFKVPLYIGHNPAAAVMIVNLLIFLTLVSVSGLIMIAEEGAGPLVGRLFASFNYGWVEGLHDFFANFTVWLVVLLVAGVLVSSLLVKENCIRAMVMGRKKSDPSAEDA